MSVDRNDIPRSPSGSNNEARRFINTHDKLHPVRRPMPTSGASTGGGGVANGHMRGEYSPTVVYATDDEVVVASGVNAGSYTYVFPTPSAGNAPWLGGGFWIQTSPGSNSRWQ